MDAVTNHEKPCKIYENNKFSKSYEGKHNTSWRCTKRGCNATIYTIDGTLDARDVVHNHPDTVTNVDSCVLRLGCKRKAMDNMDTRPGKVARTVLAEIQDTDNLRTNDIQNCKKAIYRARRKRLPALPKTLEECVESIKKYPASTSRREDFLMFSEMVSPSEGIVIFSCASNLRLLCETDVILGDGTFFVCPKQFYQLYTLHAHVNGHYIPLLFGLLPNKTEAAYSTFLNAVIIQCDSMGLSLQPEIVVLDFETAAHNAFKLSFPLVMVRCCGFHFSQAVFRKLTQLGLKNRYVDRDDEVGKWLKTCFGLPFLEPNAVEDAFTDDLMAEAEPVPEVESFADYLLDTYITSTSRFPPDMWAASPGERTFPRTTNAAEAYHRHLKDSVGRSHPNIFVLAGVLMSLQEETYVKIQSVNLNRYVRPAERAKVEFIRAAYQRYTTNSISRKEYLKTVAYKFLPVG
jgi:hypothetical protein